MARTSTSGRHVGSGKRAPQSIVTRLKFQSTSGRYSPFFLEKLITAIWMICLEDLCSAVCMSAADGDGLASAGAQRPRRQCDRKVSKRGTIDDLASLIDREHVAGSERLTHSRTISLEPGCQLRIVGELKLALSDFIRPLEDQSPFFIGLLPGQMQTRSIAH